MNFYRETAVSGGTTGEQPWTRIASPAPLIRLRAPSRRLSEVDRRCQDPGRRGRGESSREGAEHRRRHQGRRSGNSQEVSIAPGERGCPRRHAAYIAKVDMTGRIRAHSTGGKYGPRNPALVVGCTHSDNHPARSDLALSELI